MPWPGLADRMLGTAVRTFSQSDEGGESLVTYFPVNGDPYEITAVFDRAHVTVDPTTGAPVNSTNPVLGIQISQLQSPWKKGDRVQVGTTLYKIAEYQPDGVAGALLELHKP